MACQSIQWGRITKAAWTYYLGSRNRTIARGPTHFTGKAITANTGRDRRGLKICQRASGQKYDTAIMESLCGKLLFHQKEGWETTTCTGLPTIEQMDEEESKCISTNPRGNWSNGRVYSLHQVQRTMGLQQYLNQTRRWMESGLPYSRRTIRTNGYVLWPD
jgi:hypothetical protein